MRTAAERLAACRGIRPLAFALLLVPPLARAAPLPASFVYLSPAPGAQLVRPETHLIARLEGGAPGVAPAATFEVTGSMSGLHAGRTHLAADGCTLLFDPDSPFALGERVRVRIDATAAGGVAPITAEYSFDVASRLAPRFDPMRLLEGSPLAERRALPAASRRTTDVPAITSTLYGTPSPGRIFLASLDFVSPSWLLVVDDYGTPVFDRLMNEVCFGFTLQPNGLLTYYSSPTDKFYAMDSTCTVVDSFTCAYGYNTDVHELRLLPNGHALLLADDLEIVDMSAIVPGGNPAAEVVGIQIHELDEQKNVVFQWRSWDHFQITDATHEDLTDTLIDYVHANALEIDADGNLLLSSRHMDEITKIDHTTAETIWRWGGKNNQFTFVGDSIGFSHQHAIRRLDNGDYTMFDNGNYHVPQFSRALEWQLDQDAKVATLVWQFRNTPDSYGLAMGYVQRLATGNTLIGWGTGKPDVIEVAPDGSKVLEMSLPPNLVSYRAYRFDWQPPSLAGAVRPGPPAAPSLASPNPVRGPTRLSADLPRAARVSLAVYDVGGRRVLTLLDRAPRPAGRFEWPLDLSFLPAGVYLCGLEADGQTVARKLVLEK